MNFDLTSLVFQPGVEDHLRREILGFAMEGRHTVTIRPDSQADFEAWRDRQAIEAREEIELAVEWSIEEEARHPHVLVVSVGGSQSDDLTASPPSLSARTARDLGRQALRILVEDLESDRAFLLGVLPLAYADLVRRLLERGWAEIAHGGGSRLRNQVRGVVGVQRLRTFVVFDSDALEPGVPDPKAVGLSKTCKDRGVPHHRLERRESENYLPPQAIQNWALRRRERRALREAWVGLNPAQRHHFDMKRGFAGPHRPALYAGLPPRHRSALQPGFGRDIWQEFMTDNLSNLRPDWLDRDGQLPELNRLFDALLRLR